MSLWSLSTCVWKLNLECYQQTLIVISTFKLCHDVVSMFFKYMCMQIKFRMLPTDTMSYQRLSCRDVVSTFLGTYACKLNLECYQQTCIVISTFKLLHDVVSRSFQRLTLCHDVVSMLFQHLTLCHDVVSMLFQRLTLCHDVVSMLFQCSDYITCLMGFSTTMN